ncbi:MAG: 1-acyl-sn-glycerol-3-phosphate acyltransferase [Myxococcota bacterium]
MTPQRQDVLGSARFREGLERVRLEHELSPQDARKRAERALGEMWSTHGELATGAWRRFGQAFAKRYELRTSAPDLDRLRALDAGHSFVALFSHRSYLDAWILQEALRHAEIRPLHLLAGANLDFWPLGPLLRRTGALFIRRDTKDDPVYRYVLRAYMDHLLMTGQNLAWSIEGGRTRTGKLRPPRFGALRYVVDALRTSEGPEAYVLPVSVVYDQLGEVETMAAESLGASKRPEDLGWILRFAASQRDQGGQVRVDIGEPLPLRERIAALDADPRAKDKTVERIAVAVCHQINRVTPATATALVTVAFLSAERALTRREVEATLAPILAYLEERRHLPNTLGPLALSAGDAWIDDTLARLVRTGVLSCFDGGKEPVYEIAPDKHLVAAFYRNTLIHLLVVRAIGELAMFQVRGREGDLSAGIFQESMALRDLLKFEFFFPRRADFVKEFWADVARFDPEWGGHGSAHPVITPEQLERWFERSRPHMSHLVLRPFLDAYHLVASELAEWPEGEPFDEAGFLEHCLGVGKQWTLQRRLHSAESVTLELFRGALRLAKFRGLIGDPGPDLGARRRAFADQVARPQAALKRMASTEAARPPARRPGPAG